MSANTKSYNTAFQSKKTGFRSGGGYGDGIKKQELLQSQSPDIQDEYGKVFNQYNDSLTTVAFNDVDSKFRVALAKLNPTPEQKASLNECLAKFRAIEFLIDPQRIQFSFVSTPDDDIIVTHRGTDGIDTIIVHEDGSVAYAFVPARGSKRSRQYSSYEAEEADWETLSLRFLVGQAR